MSGFQQHPTRPVEIAYTDPTAPFARLVVEHRAAGIARGRTGFAPGGADHFIGLDVHPTIAASLGEGARATLGVEPTGVPTYLVEGSRLLWSPAPDAGPFMARAYYAPAPGSRRARSLAYFAFGLPDADAAIAEANRAPAVLRDCVLQNRDVLDLSKGERSGEMLVWFWYPDGLERRLR